VAFPKAPDEAFLLALQLLRLTPESDFQSKSLDSSSGVILLYATHFTMPVARESWNRIWKLYLYGKLPTLLGALRTRRNCS
jgi:hypothetical protein